MIHPQRRALPALVALAAAIFLSSRQASAFSSGITTLDFAASCVSSGCHIHGATPEVTVTGPTSLLPGTTGTYQVEISNPGLQTHAGLTVRSSTGGLAVGGPDSALTQTLVGAAGFAEICHTTAKAGSGGSTRFSFDLTAPASAFTRIDLSAYGLAVDNDGSRDNDRSNIGVLSVFNANDPTPTPTPSIPWCDPSPRGSCQAPGKSTLSIVDKDDDTRDAIKFAWTRGPLIIPGAFGYPPTTANYALCLYRNGTLAMEVDAPAGGICKQEKGTACWDVLGSGGSAGFTYGDKELSPNGMLRIKMMSGEAGKSKIAVQAKGAALADPGLLPWNPADSLTVQLVNTETPSCFEDTYNGTELRLGDTSLKGRSPE